MHRIKPGQTLVLSSSSVGLLRRILIHNNNDDNNYMIYTIIKTITLPITITNPITITAEDCHILKGITMMMIVLLMKACIESSWDNIFFVFFLCWIATEGIYSQ